MKFVLPDGVNIVAEMALASRLFYFRTEKNKDKIEVISKSTSAIPANQSPQKTLCVFLSVKNLLYHQDLWTRLSMCKLHPEPPGLVSFHSYRQVVNPLRRMRAAHLTLFIRAGACFCVAADHSTAGFVGGWGSGPTPTLGEHLSSFPSIPLHACPCKPQFAPTSLQTTASLSDVQFGAWCPCCAFPLLALPAPPRP